jgi:hypothetical protein
MVETAAENGILLLELFVALERLHEPGAGIVGRGQLLNPAFQRIDMVLGSLSNRSLRLAIIGPLSLKLGSSQRRHAPSTCARWPPLGSWRAGSGLRVGCA